MKRISVIMSTYKEPIEWVIKCVESVVNQTVKPYEYIIIVDYPDNTEMINMLKGYEEKYPFVKVVINEKNMGLVNSLNRALELCSGDYIARMDADDYCLNDRFEKQISYLESNNLDIVGAGFVLFYDEKVLDNRYGKTTDAHCKELLRYGSCMQHPTWFIKREIYKSLGGYRNIDACEDLDFLIRAALAGYKMGSVKEPLIWYRVNPNSICHTKYGAQHAVKELLCDGYKNHKSITMDEYNAFLKSDKFKKRASSLEKMQNLRTEVRMNKDSGNTLKKIRLLFNHEFFMEKIVNRKIYFINKKYA